MPTGNPGKPHPPNCAHCAALKKNYTWVDGEEVPRCKCHDLPMRWNKVKNRRKLGVWKCKIKEKNHSRKVRLKKLGLDESLYEAMLKLQNGACAICKGPPDTRWKKLAVDHCHKTGEVRGLLCMTCNTMLGRLEKRWNETMRYLKK